MPARPHGALRRDRAGPTTFRTGGADEPRCKLRGHRAAVTAVSAAPGPSGAGAWAVSASEDGTVRVWDTDKREAVPRPPHAPAAVRVARAPN